MNNDKLIDKNSACGKLVDFCLHTLKSNELKTIDLQRVIPAFYSFCYYKFQENNIELKNIDYYSNEKSIGECYAYSSKNEIHFLKTLTKKEITPSMVLEILNTTFHESQHISDMYNLTLKSNTNEPKKEIIGFFATYAQDLAEQFTEFATKTLKLPTQIFNKVYQNLADNYNKLYFTNPTELAAENFAYASTLEILNYGLDKDLNGKDRLILEDMKKEQLNLIEQHQDNLQYYEGVSQLPLTKKYINLFQKNMLEKLTDITSKYDKETNKKEKLKYGNYIVTQLPILSHSLEIVYNEEIAFNMAELTLSHIENGYDFDLQHFANTIAYCGYSPTDDQFLRLAKCYQNRCADDFMKDSNSPLTLFLDHLHKYYSYDFLLSVWSKDNPNFIFDIANCENELINIDETTKKDAIQTYFDVQNETQIERI